MTYTCTDEVVKDAACWQRRRLGEPRGIDPADYDRWLAARDARVKAAALREAAEAFDRDTAEITAAVRVANVRCLHCSLRYEERDLYLDPCTSRGDHEYSQTDLDEARKVIVEPTWEGEQLRERAAQIEQEATR